MELIKFLASLSDEKFKEIFIDINNINCVYTDKLPKSIQEVFKLTRSLSNDSKLKEVYYAIKTEITRRYIKSTLKST